MNDELFRDKLDRHERRLNEHSKEIDELKRNSAANNVQIENLCDKLEAQTRSINWLIGITVSALLGFFFYAAQQGLIK